MRIKIIKLKLYNFDELKEEVKKRVIEDYRDINIFNESWSDYIIEDWREKLENLGYKNIKIYYDLSGRQGSGACFTADVDIVKWIKSHKAGKRFRKLLEELNRDGWAEIKIYHNNYYYHEESTNVEYGGRTELSDKAYNQLLGIVEWIKQERLKIGRKIFDDLEKEYESLTSDEAVIETIKLTDFEFLEDGSRPCFNFR